MDVGEAIQKLNNLDVQDLRKIGTAPKPVQIAVILVLVIAILGAIGWFVVRPQFETLEKAERTEQELRETFEEKQSRAANLEAYKKQLAQMEESFGAMLRQLPDETDMESLLVDLSQTSVAAGLEVKYFEPGNERQQEFYAEYPIELRVAGTYHEFGNFVSGLASLPRIVTLHDIAIKPSGNGNATGQNVDLSMQLEAKTYRYLEEGGGGSGN
ncbi:MAG: type 4a pilus biogenesis protein PilO [Halofilum sp. (in: g-proteobacteria)]|nr:type 4a pilus biogenesis protein PilO [Halofilum sp. (in: g-proteobacteria)]